MKTGDDRISIHKHIICRIRLSLMLKTPILSVKHILVVDDDPEDRDLIKRALNECVNPVEIAELQDGSVVLKYLETCPALSFPALILLDLNMPLMNGFEVLMEIKTHHRFNAIPVYVFTTSSSSRDRLHSVRLGAADVLVKPASDDQWINTLCPLIDNRKSA